MNIKRFFLFCAMMAFSAGVMAQSAAEMEMAKQLARQQGYSDAQIAAMAGKMAGQGSTTVAVQGGSTVVDRNESAAPVIVAEAAAEQQALPDRTNIFGHDLFRNKNLNFVPSYNVPTPENYKLAAGDEIVIDIWGDAISNITTKISPEGSVNIPNLGPVYIAGQTVVNAEKSLKSYLSKIYSGIAEPEPTTFVKLALGRTKTVTINVVGDVALPGTYTLPSLSTIANAMYLAGGPSSLGTVRNIQLFRNNKLKSTLDVYDFILNGKFDSNIRLEDNDVIIVGPYQGVITLNGEVKRPMRYEINGNQTIADVIGYAGGFSDKAYINKVHIDRVSGSKDQTTGATGESFDVPAEQFADFKLQGGDVITIDATNNRFKNQVTISGAVWRPGTYSASENIQTLKQLIQAAGGLRDDAHTEKGYIVRYDQNRQRIQISFNVADVILGKENITLAPDDNVRIYNLNEIKPAETVRILGEVRDPAPGGYEYRRGMTLGDLILMAGGLTDAGTLAKIEIARRMPKPTKEDGEDRFASDTVATILYFNLLKNPAEADTKLEPFDIVFVRRSASYKPQQTITVRGEVNYPGAYVVEKNVVRLSDIIDRAQGFNQDAYVKGAKLTRTLTREEFERLEIAKEIAKKQVEDSTVIEELEIGQSYTVAIDLQAAMEKPGSVADIVLRTGDVITVPKYNSTVKISGSVLYPNTVAYEPGKSWKYYISNAGGVTQEGLKRKIFMVHMNGAVAAKGKYGFDVQPGTEIIVPAKERREQGQSLAAIMGIATSTASLAAMVTTIINQVK